MASATSCTSFDLVVTKGGLDFPACIKLREGEYLFMNKAEARKLALELLALAGDHPTADHVDVLRGCTDALREAAKQFRAIGGCAGHATLCDVHADAAALLLEETQA